MNTKKITNHGGTVSTQHSPSQSVESGARLGAGREGFLDNSVHEYRARGRNGATLSYTIGAVDGLFLLARGYTKPISQTKMRRPQLA